MSELNSRQEYLKRYLDGPKKSKHKKKKKSESSHKQARFRIVDDDIDMKKMEAFKDDSDDADEAPLIASIVDERPEHVKISEMYSSKQWKKFDSSTAGRDTSNSSLVEDKKPTVSSAKNTWMKGAYVSDMNSLSMNDPTELYLVSVKSERLSDEEQCNPNCNSSLTNSNAVERSHDSGDDFSPPRERTVKMPSAVTQKSSVRKNLSAPRHDSDSDISPPRAKTNDMSDSDLSPPRGKADDNHYKQRNLPPPKNKDDSQKHSLSSPRGKANQHHTQRSFSPRRRKTEDSLHKQRDVSSLNIKTANHHKYREQRDLFPSRKGAKNSSEYSSRCSKKGGRQVEHSSDSDCSPPRKRTTHTYYKQRDFSPPVRSRKNSSDHSSQSSPKRGKNKVPHSSDSDFSPSQKTSNYHEQRDLSPPRRSSENSHEHLSDSSPKKGRGKLPYSLNNNVSLPQRTLSGMGERYDSDSSTLFKKGGVQHYRNHQSSQHSPPLELHSSKKAKKRHDSGSDSSPPREKTWNYPERKDVHASKKAKERHDSDSDFSPPREKTWNYPERKDVHSSKKAKKKHDSGSDSSPPRESTQNYHERKDMHYSKRAKKQHDSSSDNSPPRERRHNSTSKKDVLYSHHRSSSQSLTHREKSVAMGEEEESPRESLSPTDSGVKKTRPVSTLSGMKAGLQNSATLREEMHNFKRQQEIAISELSEELSGRNAETISRDKDTGRRRNLKEERLVQKEKEKKNAEKMEKYLEWGKGLKQKEDQQKRLVEDMHEMSKPLARYVDDEDLEKALKEELKEGDPMLEYMRKKRQKNQPTSTSSLPVYQGPPAPPNRFNIPPGYRWDGVDRSNGFEKKYFEKINNRKATEHEAYLWSIESM